MTLRDLRITGKIFSLGMQPEAGVSLAPFLAQWALDPADDAAAGWARAWFDGNHDAILASPAFLAADVHEGAPFWFPDFYKFLHHRVPGSRFVLMLAEPDTWFRGLVGACGGFAHGDIDIHAKVFRREDELRWLHNNIPGFAERGRLVVHDSAAHYKAAYERHAAGVQDFFQGRRAEALFVARQEDPASLEQLAQWLRLPGGAAGAVPPVGSVAGALSKEALLKPEPAGAPAPR